MRWRGRSRVSVPALRVKVGVRSRRWVVLGLELVMLARSKGYEWAKDVDVDGGDKQIGVEKKDAGGEWYDTIRVYATRFTIR